MPGVSPESPKYEGYIYEVFFCVFWFDNWAYMYCLHSKSCSSVYVDVFIVMKQVMLCTHTYTGS